MPPVKGRRRHKTAAGDPVLNLPPSDPAAIEPVIEPLASGSRLQRVYSPDPYGTKALTFRDFGPFNRFDHHRRGPDGKPRHDRGRGMMYAGETLVCCLGEFFADSGEITVARTKVASVHSTVDLQLLDLRRTAATGVGTTQAIGSISQRKTSQAWSRYLYEHPDLKDIDGLLYTAGNSGHDALAFYERANGSFAVDVDLDLGDPSIAPDLELAADALHWPIAR
jgi:hypothetical protein